MWAHYKHMLRWIRFILLFPPRFQFISKPLRNRNITITGQCFRRYIDKLVIEVNPVTSHMNNLVFQIHVLPKQAASFTTSKPCPI